MFERYASNDDLYINISFANSREMIFIHSIINICRVIFACFPPDKIHVTNLFWGYIFHAVLVILFLSPENNLPLMTQLRQSFKIYIFYANMVKMSLSISACKFASFYALSLKKLAIKSYFSALFFTVLKRKQQTQRRNKMQMAFARGRSAYFAESQNDAGPGDAVNKHWRTQIST